MSVVTGCLEEGNRDGFLLLQSMNCFWNGRTAFARAWMVIIPFSLVVRAWPCGECDSFLQWDLAAPIFNSCLSRRFLRIVKDTRGGFHSGMARIIFPSVSILKGAFSLHFQNFQRFIFISGAWVLCIYGECLILRSLFGVIIKTGWRRVLDYGRTNFIFI